MIRRSSIAAKKVPFEQLHSITVFQYCSNRSGMQPFTLLNCVPVLQQKELSCGHLNSITAFQYCSTGTGFFMKQFLLDTPIPVLQHKRPVEINPRGIFVYVFQYCSNVTHLKSCTALNCVPVLQQKEISYNNLHFTTAFQYCSRIAIMWPFTLDICIPVLQHKSTVEVNMRAFFVYVFQYCSNQTVLKLLKSLNCVPVLQQITIFSPIWKGFLLSAFQYCSRWRRLYCQLNKPYHEVKDEILTVLRSSIAALHSSIAAPHSSIAFSRSSIAALRSSIATRMSLRSSIAAVRSSIAAIVPRIPVLQQRIYLDYSFLAVCVPVLQPISIVL